jgi:hypothetical protein
LLAKPPQALRFEIGKSFAVCIPVATPGEYVAYVLPRRLDPTYRTPPALLTPVTQPIVVADRPLAQEFLIEL